MEKSKGCHRGRGSWDACLVLAGNAPPTGSLALEDPSRTAIFMSTRCYRRHQFARGGGRESTDSWTPLLEEKRFVFTSPEQGVHWSTNCWSFARLVRVRELDPWGGGELTLVSKAGQWRDGSAIAHSTIDS